MSRLHRTEESKRGDWEDSTIVPAVSCTTEVEHVFWWAVVIYIYICVHYVYSLYICLYMSIIYVMSIYIYICLLYLSIIFVYYICLYMSIYISHVYIQYAEAVNLLSSWVRANHLNTNKEHTYRRESPIHRLSAVGLLRSLRAGSRGPYRWQNRIAAITHFLSLDMPSHQLPARSQILHRVSTLVEAKPQNWDQAYPDDLWLLREGDKFRQCKQLKIGTAHLEREDHLHDNRRLRWLQGLKQNLHHRIRLHRFRTLHHQG